LTARLKKTILSEKMIEDDLSRVEESATKSTYKLGVGFERCEDKGEKIAPEFILRSTYHKKEATIKATKTYYPSIPKPSFNPKREVKRETPKPREKVFVCMFSGRVSHPVLRPNQMLIVCMPRIKLSYIRSECKHRIPMSLL
jgi:hypothetical protein